MICCSHLNISDRVREYRAIVTQSVQLVHIGEYILRWISPVRYYSCSECNKILFDELPIQFRYTVMLKVCKPLSEAAICIVQPFDPLSSGGESLLTETDCPL